MARNKFDTYTVFTSVVLCLISSATSSTEDIFSNCGDSFQDLSECLKLKALKMLDKLVLIKKPIQITPYIYMEHDDSVPIDNGTENSIVEEERNLKNGKLGEMIFKRIRNLIQSKSLQVHLDEPETDVEEGRKKDKKGKGMGMMMMMGAGAMMLHAAIGTIALIAGKALIIAKIALVLASVIGLKKLVSHGGEGESTQAQIIYAKPVESGHSSGGWQRSAESPHNMAYSAQIPHRRR